MHTVSTPNAPTPAGHYSQAVVHDGIVHVAGQLPIDPADPGAAPGDAARQTRQALRNVDAILTAAGSGLHHLLQVTIYISDGSLWGEVDAAYKEMLGVHRPARAVVPVSPLHYGYLIEIQATAAVPPSAEEES